MGSGKGQTKRVKAAWAFSIHRTWNEKEKNELASKLEQAWTAETCDDIDNWEGHPKAYGQCAVTALIVQDLFGGTLRRAGGDWGSHYWNKLPNGEDMDFTQAQLEEGELEEFIPISEKREREYVLSFPDTKNRYEMLKQNLREQGYRI